MERYLSFVIVGHVDHGKSTLIGRLLYDTNSLPEEKIEEVRKTCEMLGKPFEFAFVMDHLDEEREKNITIDTSQIFFKKGNVDYVIIDAPGHKEFIKNMLTGASQADAAIVIVDANLGMEEQTKRHIYLLNMLGIEQVIVVLNKMDKVGYKQERFEEVKKELEKFLENFKIKPSHFIPISAMKGDNVVKKSENMEWYNGPAVVDALSTFKNLSGLENNELRFPIQDVYDINGEKIYVGRIESGTIKPDMEAYLMPKGDKTLIKKIKVFGTELSSAQAGKSIGLVLENNLEGIRGNVICNPKPNPRNRIKANIFWMGTDAAKKGEKLLYKSTTQEFDCYIDKIERRYNSSTLEMLEIESGTLEGLEAGEVWINLEKPIIVDNFNKIPTTGRFVLIREGLVQGGGIVTHLEE
ncbi:MAG: GTP-binding protein [Candidatus ainarchaeum sp.]|nr:GTP-binding protein [Candidatus ainarchaeum sp.]